MTILKKIPRTATSSKGNRRHYNLVVGFDVGYCWVCFYFLCGYVGVFMDILWW